MPSELGACIEAEDAVVGPRPWPGVGTWPPISPPSAIDWWGAAERAGGDHGRGVAGEGHRRQNGGEPPRQHRWARPEGPREPGDTCTLPRDKTPDEEIIYPGTCAMTRAGGGAVHPTTLTPYPLHSMGAPVRGTLNGGDQSPRLLRTPWPVRARPRPG
jgi:hypothetical protein